MSMKCCICMNAIDGTDILFHCQKCMRFQCDSCFAHYLEHCCSNCSVLNTIPICCPVSNCRAVVDETEIRRILLSKNGLHRNIWDLYVRAQLRIGMEQFSQEIPITCNECGVYSEVYVPPDAEYWKRISDENEVLIQKEIEAITSEVEEEAKEKFNAQISYFRSRVEVLKADFLEAIGFEDSAKPILENIARAGGFSDEFDTFLAAESLKTDRDHSMEHEEFLRTNSEMVIDFINQYTFQPLSVQEFRTIQNYYRFICFRERKASKENASLSITAHALSQKLKEKEVFIQSELTKRKETLLQLKATEELKYHCDSGLLQNDSKTLFLTPLPSSSQYFLCQSDNCPGAFCLKCESFLQKSSLSSHLCKDDELSRLHVEVMSLLTEAASRRCPACGVPGRKDLECTVITCEKCSCKYCYVCGKCEGELDGGFAMHNQWNLNISEDLSQQRCPLYLQYMYGDVCLGERMCGEPDVALSRFHQSLQKNALNEKQEQTSPALWNELMSTYFPDGIFDE